MKTEQSLLVDAHTHMCDPDFDRDRIDVLERARAAGLAAIITVGENLSDARKNLSLADRFPMLKVAAGLYPAILDLDSRQKQKLVKQLPLSCLMVETDSPVLGPSPGIRNEPANLPVSIEAIAEIKGIHKETVVEAVVENTTRLYTELHEDLSLGQPN